ncbi:DNA-binding transcriptional regulator, LysR family [Pseudoalteromonas denitrificans DSM 6059]|uniref:DNA-binding transcriptional regulator, LysR family n=2 Tax=Pseudoalteromonas TaxID=53246 RepID=A0A1I1Q721_9GAMM|nr:DNA-binding transcriptional regulator, LysR family [Pseudoalteromonas denitrificans DSM 6059]
MLAQTKNFSRAAQLRHITQPAFSRRIKALETHLNCKLINRLYQPIKLTKEGLLFEQSALKIINELDFSLDQLHKADDKQVDLTISATHTLSLGVFPLLVQHLNQLNDQINTSLKVADADDCINLLSNKSCDYLLAFSDPLLATHQADSILLGTIKLLPVCKPDDNGKALYSLTDHSQKVPFLAYQYNIYLGRVVNQLLNNNRQILKMRQILEAPMADTLKMMAIQGLGIAWIPEFSIYDELANEQLTICGEKKWHPTLEVRLYRHHDQKKLLEPLWQHLMGFQL